MSKQPSPAPITSAVGPCPTITNVVGRPGTGSLPSTFAPPHHPSIDLESEKYVNLSAELSLWLFICKSSRALLGEQCRIHSLFIQYVFHSLRIMHGYAVCMHTLNIL